MINNDALICVVCLSRRLALASLPCARGEREAKQQTSYSSTVCYIRCTQTPREARPTPGKRALDATDVGTKLVHVCT